MRVSRTIRSGLFNLVAACVLPALLGLPLLVYVGYQQERAAMEQSASQTARALALAVDRELAGAKAATMVLAASHHLTASDLAAFQQEAAAVLDLGIGNNFVLSDNSGKQLVNTLVRHGEALPSFGVERTSEGGGLHEVFKTGQAVVSNVFAGPVVGRLVVAVDVPVRRNDQVVYALSMIILPERLSQILQEQNLPPDWQVAIYDMNGVIAARSHQPEKFVGQKLAPAMFKLKDLPEGMAEMTSLQGTTVSAFFSRPETSRWGVVMGIPQDQFLVSLRNRFLQIALVLAAVVLACFGLAWAMGERIAGSIRSMLAPARALGAGDAVSVPRLPIREADEVGQAMNTASELIRKKTREITESRSKMKAAMGSMSDAVCVADAEGRIIEFNAAFAGFYKFCTEEECAGFLAAFDELLEMHSASGELLGPAQWPVCRALQGQIGTDIEISLQRRDTGERWLGAYNYAPLKDDAGSIVGAVVTARDVTRHNQVQARLLHLARRSEAMLKLPGVAETMDERGFMQYGLAVTEELTGSRISFVHFVHEDQEAIELVAWSQATLAHYCTAAHDKHYPLSQAGIWADALRLRAPLVVNDYASAEGKHGLPDGHARLDRLISVPVMEAGLVRMMLGVGNKPQDYSDIDVETALLMAEAMWRIVQQRRSDTALREQAESLKEAQRIAGLGSFVFDLATGHWQGSAELDRLFGIDAAYEHTVEGWLALIVPADRDRVAQHFRDEVLGQGLALDQQYRIVRPSDQAQVWLHGAGNLELDEQGVARRLIGTVQDITAQKEVQGRIEQLAFSDPLTGMANRHLLLDRLKLAMVSGTRMAQLGALLLVDLDDFKTLNDTLGHHKGDLLLQEVGRRLARCTREGDTVARLGGDEFVVMLDHLSGNTMEAAMQAKTVGDKIIAALNEPYQLDTVVYQGTPSIGITVFGDVQEDIEQPLMRADLAMYQAKATGRNSMRFFDPAMQAELAARGAMEAGLREALKNDQFILYYQPQVTGANEITGVEALLRWSDPVRGMVSPAQFIPVAEENGLILPIGSWVLETACRQLAAWAGHARMVNLTIAVNVSARQFRQKDFVEQVLATLERTGARADLLKLELTESLLVSNVEDVIAKMAALKQKGVGFSLDDFGTGYSSLSYLKRLPLDQLKIDQGFVRDILIDPNDAAIAKMVVALADSMGLAVIAEGVETEAQRECLARMGCHNCQGYLFGRAVPVAEFEALVDPAFCSLA